MSSQMMIRIDPDLKERLYKLARAEGKTTSQMVRELVQNYVRERDTAAYIEDLWNRIKKKLTARGVKREDVGRAVRQVRKSRG